MKKHFLTFFNLPPLGEAGKSFVLARLLRLMLLGALTFASQSSDLNAQCQTCCNGSKPKSLVMIYNGKSCSQSVTCQAADKWSCSESGGGPNNAASVYITVSKNSDGSGGTYFAGTVNLNGEFTVTSAAGGSSTFPSNIYFRIFSSQGGTLLQTVKNHTSCSTPLVAGDQMGATFIKTITLADNTVCNSTPPGCNNVTCPGVVAANETSCAPFDPALIIETTPACTTIVNPPPATDCCDGSKPKSTILQYTGEGCSASNTTQPLGTKYNCADVGGGPNGDPSVYITATKNADGSGGTFFAGTVGINENFTVNSITGGSSTFPSNVYFTIYASQGGAILQKVQIHYSCSAPLVPGEQFGSLVLKGVTFADNTVCGEGSTGGGSGGTDCCNGSKPKSSTLLYNGQGCGSSNTSQPLGTKYNCSDIGGGPNGDPSVYIIASKNADGSGGTYFAGLVAINTSFTMNSASGGSSTFPSNVYFNIYSAQGGTLLQKVQIHYSCSAPLVPGDQFGSLVLQSVTFADNTVCGIQPPSNVDVEYKWLSSTTGCPTNLNQAIAGATGKTFDPPFISQTTWYVRLVRRVGCTADNEWLASNCVVKKVLNISLGITNIVCDGKGTSTTTDDTYTFVLTVTGSGGGATWQGGFSHACLGAFAIGPTPYGTPITLGPFPSGQFTCGNTFPPITFQNGANIDVSVSDVENPSCSKSMTVLSPGPCSSGATASLGDFVWNDLNQNGSQNGGEPGVPGVTVKLFRCDNTFVAQQTTNASGNYLFTNLPSNQQYYVEFSGLPAGFQFSPKDATADNIDSDANTVNGRTDCTFLSPGEQDLSVDAGIFSATPQPASVGDFVWNDLDKDGVQDPGEPGVQGVVVKLFTCIGTFVTQQTTNANGNYLFTNLAAGSYFIQFSNLPTGFQFSPKDQGGNDATDSDVNTANGNTDCFNLAPGQTDLTRDAGINQPNGTLTGKIGDFVWFDTDGDGIQEPGEPGIPGVFVILETCAGVFVNFVVTDPNGMYMFNNVAPGDYRVKFANPGTFNGVTLSLTVQNAGLDDTKDSDADFLGFTTCTNIAPGEIDLTIDAGFTGQTPPAVCVINGVKSNVVCNNNGTSENNSDDTFTFTLTTTGTNTGAWGYDIPSLNLFMLNYGQPYNLGPFQISNGAFTLQLFDHDVIGCGDTVHVVPPPPCSGGTGGCNVTITPSAGKITVSGLSAPHVSVKVFNASWQTVFDCLDNCNNPQVVNLPAGTYFVKVQLFNAQWQQICLKEQYVTITSLTGSGNGSSEAAGNGDNSNLPADLEKTPVELGVDERSGNEAAGQPDAEFGFRLYPNPASGSVQLDIRGAQGKAASVQMSDLFGREIKRLEISELDGSTLEMDLSGILDGVYLLRLLVDGEKPEVRQLVLSSH